MDCAEFIALIERYAPPEAAAAWDNSGIQVESGRDDVNKVCIALDPTPATVSAALELKADFLLCHHPLLLAPRFLNIRDQYFHIIRKLMHADCRLYSAHTSLDANPHGPASWLGKALCLDNCRFLEPTSDTQAENPAKPDDFSAPAGYGFGLIGNLPEAVSLDLFLAQLEDALLPQGPHSGWRLCGQTSGKNIRKVAYCTGSGASLIGKAGDLGADIYITGDIKYHDALDAPLCVLDVGHFCLEERMMQEFTHILKQARPDMDICFLPADNPFRQVAI